MAPGRRPPDGEPLPSWLAHRPLNPLPPPAQVGTFTLFQETYHRPTFAKMHVSGPKSDYAHRLLSQDRAMIGGIDDVGIGALFGLVRGPRCARWGGPG